MTFSSGPIGRNPGGGSLGALIASNRLTTWQPGITYNGGIPAGRTQAGSTLTPLGQLSTFTGTVTNGSTTLTVSGVTGSLAADQLVCDAALTTCFGLISSGGGTTWTLNDSARMTATSVAMVGIGNDRPQINTALNAAASGTFVKLAAGTFYVGGNGISHTKSNVTLRGTGQWTGSEITVGDFPPASPSVTIIWKADFSPNPNGLLYVGNGSNAQQWSSIINLAQDAVKGTKTATLATAYGGSVGDLVLIDMVGDTDTTNVFWGNRHELSGYFNGSLNGGTALTVNSIQNGPTGVAGAFNGTLSGAGLTIDTGTLVTGDYVQAGLPFINAVGISVFDLSNNFKGYIVSGTYPTFTLSQSNSGFTGALVLGGVVPQINSAIYDSVFSTFYGFVQSGTYPNFVMDRGVPTLTNVTLTSGGGTRRFFSRQDRPISQMMMVAAIDGPNKTVTFETPFHITFQTTFSAQISNPQNGFSRGIGIEDLTLYHGMGGDGNANLPMGSCTYSWVKNVQALYAEGTSIGFYNCYRCEVRASYMHSTFVPNPGGGGYLSGMNNGTADCLFEDNIMWGGNKVVVMRGTGGGNVIAYNYMDDSFGASYPMSPEAGVNAGHYMCPHFELLEGNYSAQHQADSFWGNSIYVTVFRNWITGLRAAANLTYRFDYTEVSTNAATAAGAGSRTLHFASGNTDAIYAGLLVKDKNIYGVIPVGTTVVSKTATTVTISADVTGAGVSSGDTIEFDFNGTLNNYQLVQSGPNTYPYIDSWGRTMNYIQAHNYNYNICGNVLGYSGMGFLGFNTAGNYQQTAFVYENLGPNFATTGSDVEIYIVGPQQDPGQTIFILNQAATLQRDGNWDWFTNSQRWHGVGGAVGSRQPVPIPDSYYLLSKPAFWDANPWPWVNPANGTTTQLPAKTRFEALGVTTPIPPGNQ